MDYWDQLYTVTGTKDFIYFVSSPALQDQLFFLKLIFIFFTFFFLCTMVWFYVNSTYLRYQFLQDTTEFFSKPSYGVVQVNRRWQKLLKRTESGTEADYKLAIIEADDLLQQALENKDFEGETFEELVASASYKSLPNYDAVLEAHTVRNSIVYEPDFHIDGDRAKKILSEYETAIKNLTVT